MENGLQKLGVVRDWNFGQSVCKNVAVVERNIRKNFLVMRCGYLLLKFCYIRLVMWNEPEPYSFSTYPSFVGIHTVAVVFAGMVISHSKESPERFQLL